jgi:high-affinity Fe2+/Pb2+ permease
MRAIPLTLILTGLLSALIAALQPASTLKGRARLLSSFAVAAGFLAGGVEQVWSESRLWPGSVGLLIALWLAWIGWRKYQRDPDGKTPASKML